MSDIQLGIKISADGSKAISTLNQVAGATKGVGSSNSYASSELKRMTADLMRQSDAARQSARAMAEAQAAAKAAASSFTGLGTAIGLVTSVMSGRELYGIIAEYDRLNASLKTVTGSTQTAVAVMDGLKQFARETPYELSQVTEAFIRMRSMGLDASMDAMRSMGNTASAMGKPLMQFIEAVADASTNEFERLKEFGIKAKQEGDQVTFTFQGVETTVQKSASAIQEYLLQLGRTKFAGGMVDQMNTVDGALSNVKDSFSQLVDTIGNLGVRDALKRGFAGVTEFLDQLRQDIESVHSMGQSGTKANLENQRAMYRNIVDRLSRGGADVTIGIGSTEAAMGRSKALEDAKTKLAELEKQLVSLNGEIAKTAETTKSASRSVGSGAGGVSNPLGIAQQFQGMTEHGNAEALTRFLNEHSGTVFNNLTVPWCARFVNASLDKAGIKGTGSAAARSFENFGKGVWQRGMSKDALADVQPGDIAVFTRKGGGHVGFVKAIDPTKGLLEILGGNQSNAVSVAKRSMQDLIAVRRPIAPGTKGEYEDFDKFTKRSEKEQKDAQREAEKRQREATQRYIANLDDQAKAAQRQAEMAVSGIDNQISALDRERDAWDKAQQDKLDAAKGSYDAMAQLEAERAATLQEFAGRELALIQRQFDARKQAMDAAASAFRKQLTNPNLTDDEERRAKQSLADVQADLVKLANERAQAEAKAGQAAQDANRGGLELAQKQREFIGKINADLEFQKQLYIQLKAAKESGASAEGLSILRSTAQESGQLPGAVSQAEIQRLESVIAQTKIYEQAIADLSETQQQREESVREQQLRENAYWDQLINRMEQYADTWREITGIQNDAFSRLTIQTNQYAKSVNQIGNAYDDLNKTQGDAAGVLGIAEGAAQAQAALNLMAQTMLALRSQYEEGTQGYEDMTAAAERMMEVQRALQLVEAVLGVVHQATSGDVYTAIPRMIGVAAMMASMGLQTGIGGSANAGVKYAAGAGQQDSGVFGDPSGASESITKSLEIIRDNSSNDLNYSAAMLRALENIEASMKGVTNTVVRGVRPANVRTGRMSGLGDLDAGGIDPLGAMIGDLIFSTTRKIADFGIQASQQALSDILKKGFSGQVYTDIETTSKVLGMTVSKSVKTVFEGLDPTIAREFTRAFQSISRAVVEGGKAFGLTSDDFVKRMRGFIVDIGKISTKDLTGEQLQEKITQMFSEQSDRIARRFMPKLGPFQQVGEGYFQTFIRVADAVNRSGGELERLGVTAINFRDVVEKQADVAAEIVRQSLLAQEGLGAGVSLYISELTGSAEEIIDAYKKLKEAAQGLRTAGLGSDVTRFEINAGGGLDAYIQALNTYLETYLTPSEQLIGGWQNIADEFARLGVDMPANNAEFRKLVESIDVSTEAGQKLRGAVISLAPAFADLSSAMNESMSALQDAYNTAKEQAKSLKDYLDSLKTGDMASGSPLDRYRAAQQQYEDLLRRYNAGDVSVTPDMLQSAASTYLSLSKQIFAGTTQYASDVQRVESSLSGIAGKLDAQISKAAAQVPALESNTGAVNSLSAALASYTETMRRVGEIISGQKINGASIDDINAGNNQDAADKAAKDAKEQEAQAFEKRLAEMTRDLRYAREHDQDNKADKIKADIEAYIAQIQASGVFTVAWDGKRHDVSYRAKGGFTAPGWTVVGEQGPELVNFTAPSRVYTAQQTREALSQKDDGKTFAALEAIKDEMRALVRTQSGANPAIIGELQALRERLDQLERNQRIKA